MLGFLIFHLGLYARAHHVIYPNFADAELLAKHELHLGGLIHTLELLQRQVHLINCKGKKKALSS